MKIDRCFIAPIAASPEDAAVVRTLITLAETLGLELIAEGVELQSQLDALQKAGCKSAQGVPLSPPLVRLPRRLPDRPPAGGSRRDPPMGSRSRRKRLRYARPPS